MCGAARQNHFPVGGSGQGDCHALAVQGFQKGLRAGFGLHLFPVKGENTFIDAIGNGLAGLGQPIGLLEICGALGQAHGEENLPQPWAGGDPQGSQVPLPYRIPHPHGVQQGSVCIKNSPLDHWLFFLSLWLHCRPV